MSITIRLTRIGRKNLPAFRIVVSNTRSKLDGEILDTIGSYNPMEKPELLKVDKAKLAEWQKKGALMSQTVKSLLDGSYKFVSYPSAKKLKREAKKAADQASKQ